MKGDVSKEEVKAQLANKLARSDEARRVRGYIGGRQNERPRLLNKNVGEQFPSGVESHVRGERGVPQYNEDADLTGNYPFSGTARAETTYNPGTERGFSGGAPIPGIPDVPTPAPTVPFTGPLPFGRPTTRPVDPPDVRDRRGFNTGSTGPPSREDSLRGQSSQSRTLDPRDQAILDRQQFNLDRPYSPGVVTPPSISQNPDKPGSAPVEFPPKAPVSADTNSTPTETPVPVGSSDKEKTYRNIQFKEGVGVEGLTSNMTDKLNGLGDIVGEYGAPGIITAGKEERDGSRSSLHPDGDAIDIRLHGGGETPLIDPAKWQELTERLVQYYGKDYDVVLEATRPANADSSWAPHIHVEYQPDKKSREDPTRFNGRENLGPIPQIDLVPRIK